jgi:2-dehydropantoate 2-reductase
MTPHAPLLGQRIAIIGAGAIGGYYGGLLAHGGHDVHFLLRADLATVRAHGLTIHTKGRTLHLPRVQCAPTTAEIGPVDLVLIALKTTANPALETLLPPLLGPHTTLLTVQNGLGNEEFLATRWGADRVLGALCFVCINRTAPGIIHHLDHGSISLGEFNRPISPRVQAIADAFLAVDVEAHSVEHLAAERWRKLLWNIPFNGLSIAARARVNEVLASPHLRATARALITEVLDAARRLGHEIPDDFADWQIERSHSMGAYQPSSMLDYEQGHPVEVEAIWGEPLRQGQLAGAHMPRLELLHHLLTHLTATTTEKTR